MIFFLLIVQLIAQNIVIDPNVIGYIANYSFIGSSIINYNAIKINLPQSYQLQNGNSYVCNFNGALCIANGNENSILINGLAPQNNDFILIIFNLENGLLAQKLNYELEIYLDDLLIDTLNYSYLLYQIQQFQVQCIFSNYFTFLQSDLLINFTVENFVKQDTILQITFPYINNQDQQSFSMLMNISKLNFQEKELSYQIDFNANTLQIFNLFEADSAEQKEFLITIKNVYTQNYEYQTLPIKFTTIYLSYEIYTCYFVDNSRFIPSNPEIFTLISSDQYVEQYTNLQFFVQPRFGYSQNSMLIVNFKNQQNIQIINDAEFIPKTNFNSDLIVNKLTQSFTILNFNKFTDATSFEFELRNIKNPIGDYNLEIEVTIAAANQNRIESVQQNLAIQTAEILQYDMKISNQTVFAISNFQLKFYLTNNFTKTSIILFLIPDQLNLLEQELYFQNSESSTILIEDRKITLTGYFSENIDQNYIEIHFRAQLAGTPQLTNSFQLFIVETNNFIINQLVTGMEFKILPSSFQIISIQPQIKIADYLTNFQIVLDIPEINFGSQLNLKILDFNLTESTLCSAQINSIQNYCKINNQQILIQMNSGGILSIIIYQILTNRFVGLVECQFEGNIYSNQIISSHLMNSKIQYEILEPQTFYSYLLQLSNLFYGEESQITITFFLQSRILPTDILKIIFPSILANINYCNNSVISISQNVIEITQLQTGYNTIVCSIYNPISNEIISPFEYQIVNLDNQLIAYYNDYFGIQQNLKEKNLQFQISQSSLYYKEVIGLKFAVEYSLNFHINDLVIIIIQNCPLTPLQLEIVSQSNDNRANQISNEFYFLGTDLYLILKYDNIQNYNLNTIFLNGFQLNNEAGIYQVDIQIQHLNQYNQILEENTQPQNFTIICSENCEKCFDRYDKCTKCSNNFLLYKGSCVFNCPIQTVQVNQTCFDCLTSQDCLICDKNELQTCQKCASGFKLVENYCIKEIKIQQNQTTSALQSIYQSGEMTNINNKNFNTSELQQISEQIPIWFIVMSGQTIYVIILKCRNKRISFFKNYYIQIVLLDIPAAILRFVRFAFISYPGFFFMAMVSLVLTLGLQILGSSQILLLKSSKLHYSYKIKYITVKEQIILLFQWRYFFSLIDFNQNDLLIQDLIKLLKAQLISQILPIVFLIAFLSNVEKLYIFVVDDIFFNIIVLIIQFTKNKWPEIVQISPEQPKNIEENESLKQGQEIDIIAK